MLSCTWVLNAVFYHVLSISGVKISQRAIWVLRIIKFEGLPIFFKTKFAFLTYFTHQGLKFEIRQYFQGSFEP